MSTSIPAVSEGDQIQFEIASPVEKECGKKAGKVVFVNDDGSVGVDVDNCGRAEFPKVTYLQGKGWGCGANWF